MKIRHRINREPGGGPRFRLPSLGGILQDLRYGARMLRRSPGFTLVAVAVLALGIGANTAVFSVMSAVLLKPLPFKNPSRLVVLWEDFSARGGPVDVNLSPATYVDWKTRSRSFEDMAAMDWLHTYNLTGSGRPKELEGVRATANLFSVLGLHPILGRTFSPDDEGPDANPVVIVSRSLWLSRFGGDPGLIGRSIVLDGLKRTVIGIVPDDFKFPNQAATVWLPAAFTPQELAQRDNYYLDVIARLKPSVSLGQARAEMSSIATRLQREYPRSDEDVGATVTPLRDQLAHNVRPALIMLLGAVGMVLLITCANVANLLLARGARRRKELALRQALGAAQGRMLQQLLTESAMLGGLGFVAGVALSTISFGYLSRLIPRVFPQGTMPALDGRVLALTAAVTVVTVLLFGSGPALAAARVGFSEAMKRGSVGHNAGARGARLRNGLVVAEITLTAVLLVGAGLLLRSYAAVLNVNPGFSSQHVLLAETDLSPTKYGKFTDRRTFYERVLQCVNALPGVTAAGYVNYAPLVFTGGRLFVTIEGQSAPGGKQFAQNIAVDRVVSAGYFSALDVPLIRGRRFDQRDGPTTTRTVVINEAMAHRHWPGRNPIGKRFKIGPPGSKAPWLTVIGVVGNVRQMGLDVAAEPEFYMPLSQMSAEPGGFFWPKYLVVRTKRDPMALAAAVRQAVWTVDPDQPVSNLQPMTHVLGQQLADRNTQLTLVGGLAVLALLLASVGLYGVLSYMVAQRTSEIGLRMALGAQRGNVIASVVRGALVLASVGALVGIAGAFALSRLLAAFLYGVSPRDPITFVAVPALLVLVTPSRATFPRVVQQTWIPCRRCEVSRPTFTVSTRRRYKPAGRAL